MLVFVYTCVLFYYSESKKILKTVAVLLVRVGGA